MPIAHRYLDNSSGSKTTHHLLSSNTAGAHTSTHGPVTPLERDGPLHKNIGAWEQRSTELDAFESRDEFIKRVKREQRPAWTRKSEEQSQCRRRSALQMRPETPPPTSKWSAVETGADERGDFRHLNGLERPRSALHTGDFREAAGENEGHIVQPSSPYPSHNGFGRGFLGSASTSFWNLQDSPLVTPQSRFRHELSPKPSVVPNRSRAASQSSLSSSFTYRTPTSKLVQQSNSNDFVIGEEPFSGALNRSPEKIARRQTYSARQYGPWPTSPSSHSSPSIPALQLQSQPHDRTAEHSTHQRRSMTAMPDWQNEASPVLSSAHLRRPSVSSDASVRQHAPMVGRYEESILRGRMSTIPSLPLDFVAQIGVLGKGQCRSSLRCPPHVTVPFPAVFYNYGSHNGRSSGEGPSPYVGLVDLDMLFKKPNPEVKVRDDCSRPVKSGTSELDINTHRAAQVQSTAEPETHRSRFKKTSQALKRPPNGCYRIPPQGQLQIIIKNPNKTAVKLFLIPYDLTGMAPGQKTFIRQRSYSAGPIIDMPLSSRTNYGTDRPEAALSNSDDPNDRPILRYLIHVHICCPSEGRFYLYKGIRVVFANRVPDGKEKLRNEVQFPEPRYSIYKPEREIPTHDINRNSNIDAARSRPEHSRRMSPPILEELWNPNLQNDFAFPTHGLSNSPSKVYQNSIHSKPIGRLHLGSVGEELSPRTSETMSLKKWRLLSPGTVLNEQDESVLEQATYGKLEEENMKELQRTRSPKPGEGLIALKLRDWTAEKDAADGHLR